MLTPEPSSCMCMAALPDGTNRAEPAEACVFNTAGKQCTAWASPALWGAMTWMMSSLLHRCNVVL